MQTVACVQVTPAENGFGYIVVCKQGCPHYYIAKDVDTLLFDLRNLITGESTPVPEAFYQAPVVVATKRKKKG